MNCLKCNSILEDNGYCTECNTDQESYIFENLGLISFNQILSFVFQSGQVINNVDSIKSAIMDLTVNFKKEANIIGLILNNVLLDKINSISSIQDIYRLVPIEVSKASDLYGIKEEDLNYVLICLIEAINPEHKVNHNKMKCNKPNIKDKMKKRVILKPVRRLPIFLSFLFISLLSIFLFYKFKDNMVSVIFTYDNNNTIVEYNVEKGSYVPIPVNKTMDGYIFKGWDDGETFMEGTGDELEVPPFDVTYTAVYEKIKMYTVTFKDFNGTVLFNGDFEENAIIEKIPVVNREGYIFDGWFNGKDTIPREISDIRVPNYDIIFTATYKEREPEYYDIVFKDFDGNTISALSIIEKGNINSSDIPKPIRQGYTFIGWKFNGSIVTDNYIDNINEDRIYEAVYEEEQKYFVTFKDYDGTILFYGEYKENTVIANIPRVNRSGYIFEGWFNGKDTLPNEVSNIIVPNYDIVYTATYKEAKPDSYKVLFKDYDGTVLKSLTITEGRDVDSTIVPNPSRNGYSFKGWSINGTVVSSESINNVYENRTYIADYEKLNSNISTPSFTLTNYDVNAISLDEVKSRVNRTYGRFSEADVMSTYEVYQYIEFYTGMGGGRNVEPWINDYEKGLRDDFVIFDTSLNEIGMIHTSFAKDKVQKYFPIFYEINQNGFYFIDHGEHTILFVRTHDESYENYIDVILNNAQFDNMNAYYLSNK